MGKSKNVEQVKNNESKVESKPAPDVVLAKPDVHAESTAEAVELSGESLSRFHAESASIQEQCSVLKQLYGNIMKSIKALETEHAKIVKSTEKRNKMQTPKQMISLIFNSYKK